MKIQNCFPESSVAVMPLKLLWVIDRSDSESLEIATLAWTDSGQLIRNATFLKNYVLVKKPRTLLMPPKCQLGMLVNIRKVNDRGIFSSVHFCIPWGILNVKISHVARGRSNARVEFKKKLPTIDELTKWNERDKVWSSSNYVLSDVFVVVAVKLSTSAVTWISLVLQ